MFVLSYIKVVKFEYWVYLKVLLIGEYCVSVKVFKMKILLYSKWWFREYIIIFVNSVFYLISGILIILKKNNI